MSDDPIGHLFKDIVEEEFDLPNIEEEDTSKENTSLEDSISKSPDVKVKMSESITTTPIRGPTRYLIETVLENDEDNLSDEENASPFKLAKGFGSSTKKDNRSSESLKQKIENKMEQLKHEQSRGDMGIHEVEEEEDSMSDKVSDFAHP